MSFKINTNALNSNLIVQQILIHFYKL